MASNKTYFSAYRRQCANASARNLYGCLEVKCCDDKSNARYLDIALTREMPFEHVKMVVVGINVRNREIAECVVVCRRRNVIRRDEPTRELAAYYR